MRRGRGRGPSIRVAGVEAVAAELAARLKPHGAGKVLAHRIGCTSALLTMVKSGRRRPNAAIARFLGFRLVEEQGGPAWVIGPPTDAEREQDALDLRRRRYGILTEDGLALGLTARQSEELAKLEAEFGRSPVPPEMRADLAACRP